MSDRLLSVAVILIAVLALVACAPEPPAVEEAPPPPPAPPPTVYNIGEVDIVAEEPGFTSLNVSLLGVKFGDVTNDLLDVLGDQEGDTQNWPDHYVSYYRDGGLIIHTFKNTGEIRKIEILTRLASGLASTQLQAWLEDGDVDAMRAFMGQEEDVAVGDTGGTEYVYDSRGIRFVAYEEQNGIRFSFYRN